MDEGSFNLRLGVPRCLDAFVPCNSAMKVSVNYIGPLPAPIAKGEQVATLRIEAPNMATIERPLIAGANIASKDFIGRLGTALEHLMFGSVSK